MAYCRFGDGDVYIFPHVHGGIECCSCSLAEKVTTIWTKGYKSFLEICSKCNGKGCEECWCKKCKGVGCDFCMMYGSINLKTYKEALEHLKEHRNNGDYVPEEAFDGIKQDMEDELKEDREKNI